MKKINSFLLIGVAFVGLTACDSMSPDQRAVTGGLGGAAVGGLLGNNIGKGSGRTFATILGAGAGAVAGSSLARGTANKNRQQREVPYYRGRDGKYYPVR